MAESASVEITVSFDGTDLARILSDVEAEVMREHRVLMVKAIKDQWVGWKYKGRNLETVGRSQKGWHAEEQTTEGMRTIVFKNDARGFYSGKPYVKHVARSKAARPEWEIARENLLDSNVPAFVADLEAAIADAIDTPGPAKKVRKNKSSTYKSLTLQE